MSCEEFWENTPPGLEHLRDCPACAAAWESDRRIAAKLKDLSAHLRRVEAPARVERRLVHAFRGETEVVALRRRAMWSLATWGGALAATVALAFVLVHGGGRQAPRSSRPSRNPVELAMLQTTGAEGIPEAALAMPGEDEAAFIPLPNAEEVSPTDEVDVVRLEVPRSTMIALGYPVTAQAASDEVEAEVALGPDGTARAIRFLDE